MSSKASHRLAEISGRLERSRRSSVDQNAALIAALGNRDYHLPGNNATQDYFQYFANNHPLFGICCHNRLSPVGFRQRICVLIGSMAFGLALTNFIVLYFLNNPNQNSALQPFFKVSFNVTVGEEEANGLSVSSGQVFLWVFGSAFHSAFDLSIWHISACVCCQPGGQLECLGKFKPLGNYLVIFVTILVVAAASFIVMLRAALDNNEAVGLKDLSSAVFTDDQIQFVIIDGIESYEFLLSWLIEVATSLFVWYFILGSILWSGVLGCGELPFLGCRPRDVKVEEWEKKKQETRASTRTSRTIGYVPGRLLRPGLAQSIQQTT